MIHGGRLAEASSVVEQARLKFPKDAALAVFADLIAETKAGKLKPNDLSSELAYTIQ